jgi:hypothetical protein
MSKFGIPQNFGTVGELWEEYIGEMQKKSPNHLEDVFCFVFPRIGNWFMKEASTQIVSLPHSVACHFIFYCQRFTKKKYFGPNWGEVENCGGFVIFWHILGICKWREIMEILN